ncbi:class I SAM-dependent methyltransferase [Actinomadura parmotrematis]|uniref:Class I SAM-dependent methyltransferase n=1 Tax=Actinomadura parmotrematis TaxID=2864039 RepID=A0ABS7G6I7_9ACTN|nr:class I SAM-dependent methyltransferase [Actinomadura parmotrematis]MBW8487422.1 class I SAM-dependent methyltransferase [Actinomadura parmotrematis]
MDIEGFRGLLTERGRAALAEAAGSDVGEDALLATASRLRGRYPAELVNAALTQVRLRERARAKFGDDAARMFFTPAGLEQSTRAPVAAHRARRFAESVTGTVLELGCGVGGDLLARGRAGLGGTGVELDPLTAEVARANVAAFGLDASVRVREGDATRADPAGHGAVFADPGRRTARGRVFDPRSYEPPLDTVLALAGRAPAACVKVAPGIPHEAVPDGAEAEWVSAGGEVKEAALWLGGLAGDVRRRATLIDGGAVRTLVPDPGLGDPPVRGWGRYLYEPDGAVIRAHLVAEVAAAVGGGLADPRIAYVTSDAPVETPFAAGYEIEDVLPFSLKRLKAELRRRGVGALTVKKRGSALDVDQVRRDLGYARRAPRGAPPLTLLLTRVGDAPVALLATPLRRSPAADSKDLP